MQNIQQIQDVKNELLATAPGPENMLHQDLAHLVETQFGKTGRPLDESTLWEMVAGKVSPAWRGAHRQLALARTDFETRASDDNIPLGPIDLALDGGAYDASRQAYNAALSHFTIINEQLRDDATVTDMMALLDSMQMRLRQSMEAALSATPPAPQPQAARPTQKKGYLAGSFRAARVVRRGMQAALPVQNIMESARRAMFRKVAEQRIARRKPRRTFKKDNTVMFITHNFD